MDDHDGFLTAIVTALARTWDAKLPGFRAEFKSQIDAMYLQTPVSNAELRAMLDKLSLSVRD
jgi:hypothetical protein